MHQRERNILTYTKLSIVIPVYNEIETIYEILRRVSNVEVDLEKEIILVDDCSKDGTREILQKIADKDPETMSEINPKESCTFKVILHEQNAGKGGALRTGFKHITGEIMLIQDADLEYEPEEYPILLKPILDGEADVVYGSRFLGKKRPEGILFSSFVANKVLTWLSNLLSGIKVTDMETCYKVIKTPILKEIELTSDRFGIEPEITAKLAKKNVRLVEIPISYHGRDHATGKKINWKDGFSAIFHIIRFNLDRD
ncbi:glycosyltransferase [Candidatus Poribacteria bacterium]|nr:glycosyltransferase [Candidatus Poribacteria bacterium]